MSEKIPGLPKRSTEQLEKDVDKELERMEMRGRDETTAEIYARVDAVEDPLAGYDMTGIGIARARAIPAREIPTIRVPAQEVAPTVRVKTYIGKNEVDVEALVQEVVAGRKKEIKLADVNSMLTDIEKQISRTEGKSGMEKANEGLVATLRRLDVARHMLTKGRKEMSAEGASEISASEAIRQADPARWSDMQKQEAEREKEQLLLHEKHMIESLHGRLKKAKSAPVGSRAQKDVPTARASSGVFQRVTSSIRNLFKRAS